MSRTKYKAPELLQHVRCPECGVPMIERTGDKRRFYGCARFPICIGTRPQGGSEPDSYTKLLRAAFVKALRCLSGPKFLGFKDARPWLITQALGREPTLDEFESTNLEDLANEHVERAVDAACDLASAKADSSVDFLVYAHEERYESLRGRLRYITSAEQIQRMPKAEITRRYDTSALDSLEANVGGHWDTDGISCPRCGAVSAHLPNEAKISLDGEQESLAELGFMQRGRLVQLGASTVEALTSDGSPLIITRKWDCGNCGIFSRVESKVGADVSLQFTFDADAHDGSVRGTSFKFVDKKPK